MITERAVDCGDLYGQKRAELVALARSLSDAQLRTTVPATPAWTVHDVVSHLVGITADLNALRFGPGDATEWTAEQVRTRRTRSIEDLAGEWEQEARTFEDGLRLFGYDLGSHYIGDLLHHTADVRHALGIGILDDDLALAVAVDFYLSSFEERLDAAAVGSVVVRVSDEEFVLGSGPVVATLAASRFEALRSLGGRRSETQIRAMDWTGDVDRVIPLVSSYPLPAQPMFEA